MITFILFSSLIMNFMQEIEVIFTFYILTLSKNDNVI